MKSFALLASSVLLLPLSALAGNAVFSADGKQIFRVTEESTLQKFDRDSGVTEAVTLPDHFKEKLCAVTRMKDGRLLVSNDKKAMFLDIAKKEWTPCCEAPAEKSFSDASCDPKTGNVVFVVVDAEYTPDWLVWEVEKKKLLPVFNRRANGAASPTFALDGTLFFVRAGDVWRGSLDFDSYPEPGTATVVERFVLNAERLWPVGQLETAEGTPSGTGAREISAMATHLLIHRGRMGGSGWGDVVRVANANPYEDGLPLKWETLAEPSQAELALSPDGKQTAVYMNKRWSLLEAPDGNLVPLPKKP